MKYETIGIVMSIETPVSGVSRAGRNYTAGGVVIEPLEMPGERQYFKALNDSAIMLAQFKPCDVVKITWDFTSREYNGRWFHNANMKSIRSYDVSNGTTTVPTQQPQQQQAPQQQVQQTMQQAAQPTLQQPQPMAQPTYQPQQQQMYQQQVYQQPQQMYQHPQPPQPIDIMQPPQQVAQQIIQQARPSMPESDPDLPF